MKVAKKLELITHIMAQPLRNQTGEPLNLQAVRAVAVTPDDSTDLSLVTDSIGPTLYVGGTGNVSVVTFGNDTVTFTGVPAGAFLPLQVKRVRSTGTTATTILELR